MVFLRIIQINDVYELDNFPNFYTLVKEYSGHQQDPTATTSTTTTTSAVENDVSQQGQRKRERQPDKTLVVLAGDFLAPSLLSSLDKGAGIVDIMNKVGITHVCFGNHECDVPMDSLKKRINQSKFIWMNSNMQQINQILDVHTSEYEVMSIQSSSGNHKKHVAILGLLTNETGLYRPGSFGGAKIHPVIETTESLMEQIQQTQKVDFWIPFTHQSMADDRLFAKHFGGDTTPIIIGGHDHTVLDETVNGARIMKTGYDAQNAAIIDIVWEDEDDDGNGKEQGEGGGKSDNRPTISIELVPTSSFAPDPEIQKHVDGHMELLRELERAKLFAIQKWAMPNTEQDDDDGKAESSPDELAALPFSTKNNRLGPSVGTTALTTMLRMGLQCTCALMNAGSIRGNQTYNHQDFFTLSDLKTEIPFPTAMISMYIPGHVIQATIRYSRRKCRLVPPIASGGYVHTCNNVLYDDETESIESIGGMDFQPNQQYLTALPLQFLQGIDNHVPLLEWAKTNNIVTPDVESAVPSKLILVELFSALLWLQLGSFNEMDLDGDGFLTREEIYKSVSKHYKGGSVADVVVDNVMAIADIHNNGIISPLEMIVVHLVATDLITPKIRRRRHRRQRRRREAGENDDGGDKFVDDDDVDDNVDDDVNGCTDEQFLQAMKETAANVLGKENENDEAVIRMVEHIQQTLYVDEMTGTLKRIKHEKTLGQLRRRSILI